MKKTFNYYSICWLISLAVFNVISFVTPNEIAGISKFTGAFWVGYIFITLAFIGQLGCAYNAFKAENLKKLFASQNVALGMKNSLINATVQTIIALLVCSLAGYGFELYHDKAKDKLFSVLLLAMMIPQVATLIPLFKMMSKLGFINTVWGFMLPAISTPFLIMMFRQNSRNFPVDIMELSLIHI